MYVLRYHQDMDLTKTKTPIFTAVFWRSKRTSFEKIKGGSWDNKSQTKNQS